MTEPDPPTINTEPVGGATRRIVAVIGTIAAVLALAVWKPWDAVAPSVPSAHPVVAVVSSHNPQEAVQSATPAPAPIDPAVEAARGRLLCGSESEWRVATMESTELGTSRTVYRVAPAAASGPEDASIPTVDVTAHGLLGIGVCRPDQLDQTEGTSPVTGVNIWHISGGSAAQVAGLTTIDVNLSRVGEAYFGPQPTDPSSSSGAPVWTPGRYVIEIDDATPDEGTLWIAVDFSSIGEATGVVPVK